MVRPEKWGDFKLVGTVNRQRGKVKIPYAQFSCPYKCSHVVEIPEANVKNNKSNRCHDHLMVCTGIATDGKKAEDDPRVSNERKAAVQCNTYMRDAKRGRVGDVTAAIDTTQALRQEIITLKESKTTLGMTNDNLRGRVQDLESQMRDMRVRNQQRDERERERDIEMQKIRSEIQQLSPLVPLVQRINSELGLSAIVPPAAPIDVYVDRISGLRKAAAVASTPPVNERVTKLRRKLEEKQRENDDIRARFREQVNEIYEEAKKQNKYWRLHDPLFEDPKDSITFLRKVMVSVHPDKHHTHNTAATTVQQIFNHLVEELRCVK